MPCYNLGKYMYQIARIKLMNLADSCTTLFNGRRLNAVGIHFRAHNPSHIVSNIFWDNAESNLMGVFCRLN